MTFGFRCQTNFWLFFFCCGLSLYDRLGGFPRGDFTMFIVILTVWYQKRGRRWLTLGDIVRYLYQQNTCRYLQKLRYHEFGWFPQNKLYLTRYWVFQPLDASSEQPAPKLLSVPRLVCFCFFGLLKLLKYSLIDQIIPVLRRSAKFMAMSRFCREHLLTW